MSRKSRKDLQLGIKKLPDNIQNKVAIYARLSIENANIEANSIKNQILLAENYIDSKDDLKLIKTYYDNGYSGINFDRPDFKNMMDDIKNGKIDTILVKDLSRFSRNYLEVGNYLENIFPYLNIRFISINDNFDTLNLKSHDKLIIYLKSIMHENYVRDTSKKICSSLDIVKRSGKFLGKIPPFGYVRSIDDKYKLEIHEERALIVKQMFNWFIEGQGVCTIARKLNDLGVPAQLKIRFLEGHSDGKESSLWNGSTVINVLKNHTYLGMIVVKKSETALYKNKPKEHIDESDWEFIKNTHEPIVDEETFFLVQKLRNDSKEKNLQISEKNSYKKRALNPLSSLLFCGHCGHPLQRCSGYFDKEGTLINYHFKCYRKYLKNDVCNFSPIKEELIIDALSEICKSQINLLFDAKQFLDLKQNNDSFTQKERELKTQLKQKVQDVKLIKHKSQLLYEDFKINLLDENKYKFEKSIFKETLDKYEKDIIFLERQLGELQENNTPPLWLEKYLKFKNFDTLTSEICKTFFDKIVVTDRSLKVYFAYSNEFESLLAGASS